MITKIEDKSVADFVLYILYIWGILIPKPTKLADKPIIFVKFNSDIIYKINHLLL